MKMMSVCALGLALAGWLGLAGGPAAAKAETFKEHFEHTYPLAANGAFTLKNLNGAVSVTAWDRNEVHVVAEKSVKTGSAAEGKQRLAEIRIEASAKPDDLRIDTHFPKQSGGGFWSLVGGTDGSADVTYTIEVPKGVRVDVATVNGAVTVHGTAGELRAATNNGRVNVAGGRGKIHLESTNGAISAVDTAGSVVAETANGHIDVELREVARGDELSFTTSNGRIHLAMPHDAQASISASTTNGRVSTDLPVQARTSSKSRLEGDLNGGGARLQLSTSNGSIEITGRH